jgi:hypothetical protein
MERKGFFACLFDKAPEQKSTTLHAGSTGIRQGRQSIFSACR